MIGCLKNYCTGKFSIVNADIPPDGLEFYFCVFVNTNSILIYIYILMFRKHSLLPLSHLYIIEKYNNNFIAMVF